MPTPAPAAPTCGGFQLIHDGYYWRVAGPDGFVSGGYSSKPLAEFRLDDLVLAARHQAASRVRACLTCERAFMSGGIHNRLCPACRTAGHPPAGGW